MCFSDKCFMKLFSLNTNKHNHHHLYFVAGAQSTSSESYSEPTCSPLSMSFLPFQFPLQLFSSKSVSAYSLEDSNLMQSSQLIHWLFLMYVYPIQFNFCFFISYLTLIVPRAWDIGYMQPCINCQGKSATHFVYFCSLKTLPYTHLEAISYIPQQGQSLHIWNTSLSTTGCYKNKYTIQFS